MLQRIQTVYLLLIVVLMTATLFLPQSALQLGDNFYTFDASGISTYLVEQPELLYPAWGLFALTAVIAIVALVTIFLFRKRILQIRLCVFNALLMLGFYGFYAFLLFSIKGELGDELSVTGKIALAFPFISIVLDYLAIRNIGADEALVRSLERLR